MAARPSRPRSRPGERRRRKKREGGVSQVERIRAEAELSTPEPARSLAAAAASKTVARKVPASWPYYVCVVVAAASALLTVYLAGPLVPQAVWWHTAAAAVVAAVSAAGVWRWRRLAPLRRARTVAISAAALVALFAVGASTQVVIDGTPHLATSETAQSYKLIRQIEDDLIRLVRFDELIGADQTTVRANLASYDPAALELAQVSAKYAQMQPEDLPNDAFVPVVRSIAAGADFGSRAVTGRKDLALQYDARLESDVASFRATYAEQILSAGQQLNGIASLYDIRIGGDRPTE